MNNFSFFWFFTLFILQVLGVGIHLAKLGEKSEIIYSGARLLINVILCILSGIAIYLWG